MYEPTAICTVSIIVATCLCSFIGFRDPGFCAKYLFSVPEILAGKQYYRLVTSAFLHADWAHLLMNMISLYLFGQHIELFLGAKVFLLIYFAAIIGGDLLALWVHRNHEYQAYGASGGVCGMIFSYIILFPGAGIGSMFIPGVFIPGWLYAILYLVGSFLALKQHAGNVGHDAHLGGAIIGFWTAAALQPASVSAQPMVFLAISILGILLFIYVLKNPLFLPLTAFVRSGDRRGRESSKPPDKVEASKLDAILEKISKQGMDSLSAEEKAVLNSVSEKYQRRADSKKPESDLII